MSLRNETMATSRIEFFPDPEFTNPDDELTIVELIEFLKKRIHTRDLLRESLHQKQNNFRNVLVELQHENVSLKKENSSLRTCNDQQKKMITSLEVRIHKLDGQIISLLYKLNSANDTLKHMQQELRDRDRQMKQHTLDKQKIIQKCSDRIQMETDRMNKELEMKLREQRNQLESHIKKKDDKLKLVKQILICDRESAFENVASPAPVESDARTETAEESVSTIISARRSPEETPAESGAPSTSTIVSATAAASKTKTHAETIRNLDDPGDVEPSRLLKSKRDKIPVVNPRYRRSRSADKWINHRPVGMVPLGTILQPQTPCTRSVTKLTSAKTFATKSARYCLLAQEQDTDGELETKLYKADVLPTSGGGAQVVFNDIECLKQMSPVRARQRRVNPEDSSTHSANGLRASPRTLRRRSPSKS